FGDFSNEFARNAVAGAVTGGVRQAFGQGKLDWRQIAVDAFGNALASTLVSANARRAAVAEAERLRAEADATFGTPEEQWSQLADYADANHSTVDVRRLHESGANIDDVATQVLYPADQAEATSPYFTDWLPDMGPEEYDYLGLNFVAPRKEDSHLVRWE